MNRFGISLVLLTSLAACKQSPPPPAADSSAAAHDTIRIPPTSPKLSFIKVEPVVESDPKTSVSLTGRVSFDEDHTQRVASPIDGRAVSLLVSPGDSVKVGQSLIQLSSPNVGQIQADAQKATQDYTLAKKALDRAHTLQKDGAISDKEVAQAEADYEKAKSDTERTSAQLRALGISATDPAVAVALRSQVAGTVVERNVLVGQEVRADGATPLVTISDLHTVWVLADVYEQDLKLVQQGAAVDVSVPAYPGETFAGKVAHVSDVVDPASHTVKLRCVVPNADLRLKPEMFAKIALSGANGAKVILIPSKAVLADAEASRVILDNGGGVFRTRVINAGPEADGMVRVLAGLTPGERVVTDGALFLKNDVDNL